MKGMVIVSLVFATVLTAGAALERTRVAKASLPPAGHSGMGVSVIQKTDPAAYLREPPFSLLYPPNKPSDPPVRPMREVLEAESDRLAVMAACVKHGGWRCERVR